MKTMNGKKGIQGFRIIEDECIWMKAGIVALHTCNRAYDCFDCKFDKAMTKAALFAAELVRSYTRFAEGKGWKVQLLELNRTGLRGVKQAVLYIQGDGVFAWFKFEGGVHRVQRVPVTESQGRIHTSTATVAVLPEIPENEIDIRSDDLTLEFFRSGGKGGQNVRLAAKLTGWRIDIKGNGGNEVAKTDGEKVEVKEE